MFDIDLSIKSFEQAIKSFEQTGGKIVIPDSIDMTITIKNEIPTLDSEEFKKRLSCFFAKSDENEV